MTFLSRIARRTTALRPITTPGMSTEWDTWAPCPTRTSVDTTEWSTWPPEMIVPSPTIDSSATPASTNFGGGSGGIWVRIGHCRL